MSSVKTHCKRSKERTGDTFEKLHNWMDEPQEKLGIDHRTERHNTSYIPEVKEKFGEKYGPNAVREFLRHIEEDYRYTAEMWGRECATDGCTNNTWHRNKYCWKCKKERRR